MLVISKSLSKSKAEEEPYDKNDKKKPEVSNKNTYKGKQAHVELAEKMRKRDEGIFFNFFNFLFQEPRQMSEIE